jgi:prepilin-type processing-associated H-X9-DG protein
LLVVIGIIAVLISILLPALTRARAQAKMVACMSNLRQIGLASQMYTQQNRNYIIPMSYAGLGSIEELLNKYVGAQMKSTFVAPDVFYCPATAEFDSPPYGGYMTPSGPYKGWSGYMFGYLVNVGDMNTTPPAPVHAIITNYTQVPQVRSKIKNASEFVSMSDLGVPRLQTSGPPTSAMKTRSSFDPNSSSYIFGTRMIHRNQGNILFMDGSVRSFPRTFLHLYSVPGSSGVGVPGQSAPWN